jgi:iron complex transport system substrate-binding protein
MRLVSLACSNTEIVHALGCSHLLVGVDDHSDWPPAVVDPLPKLGPDLEPDVEKVAALEPDLVLATLTVPGHERVVARLEEAGLPFIAPEPVSIPDVYRDIREIAARLGVPERGEELVAEMRAELGDGRPGPEGSEDAADRSRPSILVQWWPKPVITPGRLSWATQLIEVAGGRAVLGHEDVKSRPMEDAEVAERVPDAVVLSWCGVHPEKYRPDVVLRNEAWQDLPFVRERRVYCVGEPYLGRPGPRLVEGVRAMRAIVAELRAAGLGGAGGSGGRTERSGDAPGATPSSSSAGAPPG